MKYYSEILNKVFNTEKECIKAEHEHKKACAEKARIEEEKKLAEKKKQEERAADAKELEVLRSNMIKSQSAYRKGVEAFIKKHGSYHYTTSSFDEVPHLFNLFL